MTISSVIFCALFIFYLWYTFSIVYHFIRFGIGAKPKTLAFVFFTGSFILVGLSLYAYSQINWQINWDVKYFLSIQK